MVIVFVTSVGLPAIAVEMQNPNSSSSKDGLADGGAAAPAVEERATWKYYSTIQIEIKLRGSRNWFMWLPALAMTLFNIVHAVFIQVIVGAQFNTLDQNPQGILG